MHALLVKLVKLTLINHLYRFKWISREDITLFSFLFLFF